MFKGVDNVAFFNDDIAFVNADSDTIVSDNMGLVNVDLNNVNIDGDNSDVDNPETIIHFRRVAWCNRYKQQKVCRKEIRKELMTVA